MLSVLEMQYKNIFILQCFGNLFCNEGATVGVLSLLIQFFFCLQIAESRNMDCVTFLVSSSSLAEVCTLHHVF